MGMYSFAVLINNHYNRYTYFTNIEHDTLKF